MLSDYVLGLAAHAPGMPWPGLADGETLAVPSAVLPAAERVAVNVTAAQTQEAAP